MNSRAALSTSGPTRSQGRDHAVALPMLANAALSLGMGLLLVIAGGTVGNWLGAANSATIWLRLLGLALMGHAGILLWASRRPDVRRWAVLNVLIIAPYPFLMIGLVVTGVVDRTLGQVLVLLDGAAVGLVALAHLWRLRSSSGLVDGHDAAVSP